MSRSHRKIGAVITLITLIASIITIYEFVYTQPPGPPTITNEPSLASTSTQSTPFDFSLNYSIEQGLLCQTRMILKITVNLISGNPRTVYLTLENGAIPPIVSSFYFSPAWATPDFDSYLTIEFVTETFQRNPPKYFLTVVADDHAGVMHTLTIPFVYPACW